MNDEIFEIGTDINKDWNFTDGDLNLVKQNENIIQSISNRLNNRYDSLNLYYNEYGSYLKQFFGWKKVPDTLQFMRMEILNTLSQDPRLQDVDVELEYGEKGIVNGYILIHFDDDTDLTLSLVLNNLGVEITEEEEDYGD